MNDRHNTLHILLAVALAGCSGSGPSGRGDDGGGSVLQDAATARDGGGGAGPDAAFSRRDAGTAPPDCGELDEGEDIPCDCLAIGTLGAPGEWGAGNILAAWLAERSNYEIVHLGQGEITPDALKRLRVIVAQDMRGRSYAESEVAALEAWMRSGGGLFTMIGYGDPSERTQINTLLEPTGIAYGEQPILAGSPTVPVETWHPHPVSMGVTRVGVDNGYPVEGAGTVVAEQSGFVLLRALELGEGRVLVWGDEWISYDSEWTDHPDYQVERFWRNSFEWLTPQDGCDAPILI